MAGEAKKKEAKKELRGRMVKRTLFLMLLVICLVAFAGMASADEPALKGVAYIQGHGGHIAVVDLATGDVARYSHGKPSDALTISEDGNTIYMFSLDGFAKELDVKTGKQTEWIKLGKKHCGSAFAPDGTIWVSDMDDGNVYVYDPKTKKLADKFQVSKSICAINFSKDGKTAYVSDMPGGFVSVVDVATKKVKSKIEGIGSFVHRGRIQPGTNDLWQSDGVELKNGVPVGVGYAENGATPGMVRIVDVAAGKLVDSVIIGGNPHDVDFTPDGKYALVVTRQVPEPDDSAIVVMDTKTKRVVKVYSVCKKCHGPVNVTIAKTSDDGKPFLCAIQVNWKEAKIPDSAEMLTSQVEKPAKK